MLPTGVFFVLLAAPDLAYAVQRNYESRTNWRSDYDSSDDTEVSGNFGRHDADPLRKDHGHGLSAGNTMPTIKMAFRIRRANRDYEANDPEEKASEAHTPRQTPAPSNVRWVDASEHNGPGSDYSNIQAGMMPPLPGTWRCNWCMWENPDCNTICSKWECFKERGTGPDYSDVHDTGYEEANRECAERLLKQYADEYMEWLTVIAHADHFKSFDDWQKERNLPKTECVTVSGAQTVLKCPYCTLQQGIGNKLYDMRE